MTKFRNIEYLTYNELAYNNNKNNISNKHNNNNNNNRLNLIIIVYTIANILSFTISCYAL